MSEVNLEFELKKLRKENAVLKGLLETHGINYKTVIPIKQETPSSSNSLTKKETLSGSSLSVADKIKLFRSLFHGREDVYAKRWESKKGTTGYSPHCLHEWDRPLCRKPDINCSKCPHRDLAPLTDSVIESHLRGLETIGIYALLPNDYCHFLAVDFDETTWQENVSAFRETCDSESIPVSVEISRSGNGAHVWLFFSSPILASQARKLGTALITRTCMRTGQLSLKSYDRLFPNQDTMPKGGFGNLIALPLQKMRRKIGRTVFVNHNFSPFENQWQYLSSIKKLSPEDVDSLVRKLCPEGAILDVGFAESDGEDVPWAPENPRKISDPKPQKINIVLSQQIFIKKTDLTPTAKNRILRLASFGNPEFHKKQALRMSVRNIPRIICCAEEFEKYIALPRGRYADLNKLLATNNIATSIEDRRTQGPTIRIPFKGDLRADQKRALKNILENDYGILWAPTGFGKTVVAAAVISRRAVPTLILVHTKELLKQWEYRLRDFIDAPSIGKYGAGKNALTGYVDIALVQSLEHVENLSELLMPYGQVVVDECHHCAAFRYEQVLRKINARYVLGLTATPVRKEGNQEIAYMQCGSICHKAIHLSSRNLSKCVFAHNFLDVYKAESIQEKFGQLTVNESRNEKILADIISSYEKGRKILVLTGRVEHLLSLYNLLRTKIEHCFLLHGRMKSREREETLTALKYLNNTAARVIFATGRLIGEGFDYPPLDTLFLATPISWKGILEQYVGRLTRDYPGKDSIWVFDYVESEDIQLNRMWLKRLKGYKRLSFNIASHYQSPSNSNQQSLSL